MGVSSIERSRRFRSSAKARRWVASLKREIPPGARVRVRSFGARRSFRSAQLGRAFPELHFGAVTVVPVPDLPAEPMNRSKT